MRKFDEIDFLEAVLEIKRSKVSQESSHSSSFKCFGHLCLYCYMVYSRKMTGNEGRDATKVPQTDSDWGHCSWTSELINMEMGILRSLVFLPLTMTNVVGASYSNYFEWVSLLESFSSLVFANTQSKVTRAYGDDILLA